ncbi:uncharacterized protein ARMOST_03207 [Armillaria ostoyae]|uniref:Uncharacterized protein n=1 Tax=Armillaria ostoyae TaxID=47428 RepID=A0A284QTV2_ARMOS|nr:uncharacterized protein ARMOST_03207 [Armillaria ostoyae]
MLPQLFVEDIEFIQDIEQ